MTGTLPTGHLWHVAWAGGAASSGCIEVPTALAAAQGITDGMLVTLRALPECPLASSVSVEPASADDWEQVELNAEYMEETAAQSGTLFSLACMHLCMRLQSTPTSDGRQTGKRPTVVP